MYAHSHIRFLQLCNISSISVKPFRSSHAYKEHGRTERHSNPHSNPTIPHPKFAGIQKKYYEREAGFFL